MTKTFPGKSVKRETCSPGIYSQGKNRTVIVSVEFPNIVGFRLKGTRTTYELDAESLFWVAMKATIAREKKEKAKAKKERKGAA